MANPMNAPISHCPWCSGPVPDPAADRCPSCGAALAEVPNAPAEIKGVTTLDTEAILRARSEVARPRGSRLLSFITGEVAPEAAVPASPESLAPPETAVRREMLRIQLEAELADHEAETVALKADELARRGIHLSELGGGAVASPEPAHDAQPRRAAEPEPDGSWPAELTPEDPESHGRA